MSVHEYELFHGIALTKILRSKKPITLRMIETRPGDDWSIYTLNDVFNLFLKHSLHHRIISRNGEGTSWTFIFSEAQVKRINELQPSKKLYIALICGSTNIKEKMHICLLFPGEIDQLDCFSDNSKSQSITIRYKKGQYLRVFKDRKEELKIAPNRLDSWEIPGS